MGRFSKRNMLGVLAGLCAALAGCKAVGVVTEEDIVIRLAREFTVAPASLDFTLSDEPAARIVSALAPRVAEPLTLHWTALPENIVAITPVPGSEGRQVAVTPLAPGCTILRAKINEYTVSADCNITVRSAARNELGAAPAIQKFYVRDNSTMVYSGIIKADKTILLELPLSYNLESLRPAVLHTGASHAPAGFVDFRSSAETPITYTVTGASGEKTAYRVTAVRTPLHVIDFLSIEANGKSGVTTTTELVLRFRAHSTFSMELGDALIEPDNAAWFSWREDDGPVMTYTIKGIKENDLELTLVPVKQGYAYTPLSRTVRVYKAP